MGTATMRVRPLMEPVLPAEVTLVESRRTVAEISRYTDFRANSNVTRLNRRTAVNQYSRDDLGWGRAAFSWVLVGCE